MKATQIQATGGIQAHSIDTDHYPYSAQPDALSHFNGGEAYRVYFLLGNDGGRAEKLNWVWHKGYMPFPFASYAFDAAKALNKDYYADQ